MSRPYTLRKRAEQKADTRRRLVEAAVDLHGSIGPANTSLSMIAERAGVQRHTLYAHFPDERAILAACSGHFMEQNPPPAPRQWRGREPGQQRLLTGLYDLYSWYDRNEGLMACVLRDAEHHALVRETAERQFGPLMAEITEVLGEGLESRQLPLLRLALSFHSWRTLVRDAQLDNQQAAAAMGRAIDRG